MKDMLTKMFEMQSNLNDYIFEKQNIKDNEGAPLKMETLFVEGKLCDEIGPNSNVNKWLCNYLTALDDESRELREELLWKFWSKDTLDMQNIRVEIVDQFHFVMSLAITAGMTADDLFKIYYQKNKVNLNRQDKNYCANTKTEDDNKGIS